MRALAWNDNSEYLTQLSSSLKTSGVEVTLLTDANDFVEQLRGARWDFVIAGLTGRGPDSENTVIQMARRTAVEVPLVVMIADEPGKLQPEEVGLPSNVVIRSKATPVGWQAADIIQILKDRGLFFDAKKVFLIYGHDRMADGTSRRVEHFLQQHGVDVVRISAENLTTGIEGGLLQRMNGCAAFIAVCTPDDELKSGQFYPRLNVLLEIGMAMGLSRGMQRLTLLQRWGPTPQECAQLPSDLGGVLSMRFEGPIEQQFSALTRRLRLLGVELTGSA